jgi:hypothetical protein
LVTALVDCTDGPARFRVRRFLQGLSADELQFLASFWGACVLESDGPVHSNHTLLAHRIGQLLSASAPGYDCDHKLLLLLEYLGRTRSVNAAVNGAHLQG